MSSSDVSSLKVLCSVLTATGIGSNVLLFWLIQRRSPTVFGSYRRLLIASTLLNTLYAIVTEFASPYYVVYAHGVGIVQNGWFLMSPPYGQLALALWTTIFFMQQVLGAVHFYYRYTSLQRQWGKPKYWPFYGLAIFGLIVVISWWHFVAYDLWILPAESQQLLAAIVGSGVYPELVGVKSILFCHFAYCDARETTCDVNWSAVRDGSSHGLLLLIMTVLSLTWTGLIVRMLRKMPESSTRRLQWQVLKSLLAQLLVPFILCDLQAVALIGTTVGFNSPLAFALIQLAMVALPTSDALLFIFLIPTYRRVIMSLWPFRVLFRSTAIDSHRQTHHSQSGLGVRDVGSQHQQTPKLNQPAPISIGALALSQANTSAHQVQSFVRRHWRQLIPLPQVEVTKT